MRVFALRHSFPTPDAKSSQNRPTAFTASQQLALSQESSDGRSQTLNMHLIASFGDAERAAELFHRSRGLDAGSLARALALAPLLQARG
jgi:hypothetical protein